MKRLVVCADGTWKSRDDSGDTTNVEKLHDAVLPVAADGTRQLTRYFPGVGASRRARILGGAFGVGLSRNVQECYRWLAREWQPGDELYLFGFSRGAFTVRSLAGMIRNVGLLPADRLDLVDEGYGHYRDDDPAWRADGAKAVAWRKAHSREVQRIRCLGVWDTVGALGVPTSGPLGWWTRRRWGFHDVQLSGRVEHAYHALAIDERRKPFAPTLWQADDAHADQQHVEQVWFAGVHSNVGGGYPDCGLSDTTLWWMAGKARAAGLELDQREPARGDRRRRLARAALRQLHPRLPAAGAVRPRDRHRPGHGRRADAAHARERPPEHARAAPPADDAAEGPVRPRQPAGPPVARLPRAAGRRAREHRRAQHPDEGHLVVRLTTTPFRDRRDAGAALADVLLRRDLHDVVVLGLPRGGVPVAAVVADALGAPLDVVVVRKLGVPWQPELAMGAVGEGGVVVRHEEVLRRVGDDQLAAVLARETAEVARRSARLRRGRPAEPLAGRTAVVVDDGLATGSTARAACAVLRAAGAGRVVLAVPVAPRGSVVEQADELVVVRSPEPFGAVGRWYADFSPTTEQEVVDLLRRTTP